jgi:hypothetical protein
VLVKNGISNADDFSIMIFDVPQLASALLRKLQTIKFLRGLDHHPKVEIIIIIIRYWEIIEMVFKVSL